MFFAPRGKNEEGVSCMTSGQESSRNSYLTAELANEIAEVSCKGIPIKVCEEMARQIVERMDFNDPYQMHKGLRGYAQILVDDYERSGGMRLRQSQREVASATITD